MKSSSAAERLKLKPEQSDDCSLELRLGFSSDNGANCGGDPWLGILFRQSSLSRTLKDMFHGFLSEGQWRIAGREDDEEEEQPEPTKKGVKSNKMVYILLYEDNEGDRMLVGDVPWELFMASVKRLYIAQDPRKTKN